jgi:ATP-dependent RNA helicase DeaD
LNTLLCDRFKDDIEFVLRKCASETQLLLFSATVPEWVTNIAKAWMRKPKLIDLVGRNAVPDTVKHMLIKVSNEHRDSVMADVLSMYTKERAIVFTETKRDATELATSKYLPGIDCNMHACLMHWHTE